MMDDTATVTKAGFKTEILNAHIVTYTANKMLQLNETKCKTMKIGKVQSQSLTKIFKLTGGMHIMIKMVIFMKNIWAKLQ